MTRTQIGAYLAGQLSPEDRTAFEQQMDADGMLAQEVRELAALWETMAQMPQAQPTPNLRARFYTSLGRERAAVRSQVVPVRRFPIWQIAAAALVLFAFGLSAGLYFRAGRQQSEEIAQMRGQVQSLREMVALSLLDRQSASSRLQGVTWSSRVDRPDNELVSALLSALNSDPNVNVRLSSVDALEPHAKEASISHALLDAIPRQQSPLVQIALIDTLVKSRDVSAMSEFARLSDDSSLSGAVRQRARWALIKLDPANPDAPRQPRREPNRAPKPPQK